MGNEMIKNIYVYIYALQLYYSRKLESVLLLEINEITYWGFKFPWVISLSPGWPLSTWLGLAIHSDTVTAEVIWLQIDAIV